MRQKEDAVGVTSDYTFKTPAGAVRPPSADLFAGRDRLLMIHNMGQGCRYCTLWADGINGVLPHLEDAMAVALVSKDPPDVQRRMALDRGWKFRLASHGGGAYMAEQCAMGEHANMPGAAVYERDADRRSCGAGSTAFGPGDLYSPLWHFLSLAGIGAGDWTAQFHYWSRPKNSTTAAKTSAIERRKEVDASRHERGQPRTPL